MRRAAAKCQKDQSTDPVRAWRSGNGWFLAQRRHCAGKCRHKSVRRGVARWLCTGHEDGSDQCHRKAGLARRTLGAVVSGCRVGGVRVWGDCGCVTVRGCVLCVRPRAVVMRGGMSGHGRVRLGRHVDRHHIARPAANRSQGDEKEDDEQAHKRMIRLVQRHAEFAAVGRHQLRLRVFLHSGFA
jgi:hypothetical protein